jgi:tripartite-type tricarboxylate transporter receptor subunit TctC
VQVYFDQVASSLQHIQSGRLRAIAVAWGSRLPVLRDIPTFGERNLPSNNDASWFGLVAPAGTPQPIITRLNEAVRKCLADPALVAKLNGQGLYPSGNYPDQFAAQIRGEIDKMQRVAKFAKILLD